MGTGPASEWSGLAVALATPFTGGGAVDLDAFRRLCRHVAGGGAGVLVPLGSTGEASTLDDAERDRIVAACLEEAGGARVCVGTGHNATAVAARLTARAGQLGAHGALVVTPYYNRPTAEGLLLHYRAIADAAPDLPLLAYNVPARTGTNMAPDTLFRLLELPSVVGVKESSGNLAQIDAIARGMPDGKVLLCGDDGLALPAIALGADGLVSVLGNMLPGPVRMLVQAARTGDLPQARRLHRTLAPLMQALAAESNPIPVKAGLESMGLGSAAVRLPLTTATPTTREAVQKALQQARDLLVEVS